MAIVQFSDVLTLQFQHFGACKNELFFGKCRKLPFCHSTRYLSISCNAKREKRFDVVHNQCGSSQKLERELKFSQKEGFLHECGVDEVIMDLTSKGSYVDAVILYIKMLENGVASNDFPAFPMLVKAIGGLCDPELAKQIHGHLLKVGVVEDIYVANSLLNMMWKCSLKDEAVRMFKSMEVKDSVSWNTMISGFQHSGHYDGSLKTLSCMINEFGAYPNRVACISALSSCAALRSLMPGREIHGYAVKNALDVDEFVLNGLLDMYMKCGKVGHAKQLFENIPGSARNNTVLWNVMISGYVDNGYFSEVELLFIQLLFTGVRPDSSTMVALLVYCSEYVDLAFGKQIHAFVIKMGLVMDVRVGTSLIDMYFKCSDPVCGIKLFDRFDNRNIVMWGTAIMNCSRSGFSWEALKLFVTAYEQGISDPMTLLAALRACSSLTDKPDGMVIHGISVKLGLGSEAYIGSALVDMYAKCQDIVSARKFFSGLPVKDEVLWSSLISGYAQNDLWIDAMKVFVEMQSCGVKPNAVMIACVLSVCACISSSLQCKEIHGYIIRHDFKANTLVNNALITAYAKSGSVENSRRVFLQMEDRDQVSWNSIMLGLGLHGHANEMLLNFDEMRKFGLKPDHQTFTAMLSACSHTGKVAEGLELFRSMTEEHMLEPKLEQYTCLVDLLGRAGYLNEAYDLVLAMPCSPDDRIWGSLLGSCKTHGNERLAELVAQEIFKLDPCSMGYHVLLTNLYEDTCKWNEVTKLRSKIERLGLKKSPGCSWIDVDNQIHVFTASDESHNNSEDIYDIIALLNAELETKGHVPRL